jgi:hypothetical protein
MKEPKDIETVERGRFKEYFAVVPKNSCFVWKSDKKVDQTIDNSKTLRT